MATYTIELTAEQDAVLQALATAAGYASAQSYVTAKAAEILTQQVRAADDLLLWRARHGATLTSAEQARLKAILGLA